MHVNLFEPLALCCFQFMAPELLVHSVVFYFQTESFIDVDPKIA